MLFNLNITSVSLFGERLSKHNFNSTRILKGTYVTSVLLAKQLITKATAIWLYCCFFDMSIQCNLSLLVTIFMLLIKRQNLCLCFFNLKCLNSSNIVSAYS